MPNHVATSGSPAWMLPIVQVATLAFFIAVIFYGLWVYYQLNDVRELISTVMRDAKELVSSARAEVRLVRNQIDSIDHRLADGHSRFAIQLGEAQKKADRLAEEFRECVSNSESKIKELLDQNVQEVKRLAIATLDRNFEFDRTAIQTEEQGVGFAYRSLLKGMDDAIALVGSADQCVADQTPNWCGSVHACKKELIAAWDGLVSSSPKLLHSQYTRPTDPNEEVRWSMARFDGLQDEREGLDNKRKALMKWFQNWLPLWQEIEALAAGSENGESDQVAFARQVDEIIRGWQYQTELRLLQPARGEKFNQEEMRRAGEEVVEDESQVGRVVALRRRGYAWGGRVLEPAAVIVGVKHLGEGGDA